MSMHSTLKAWLERANLTQGGEPTKDGSRRHAVGPQQSLHFAKEEMERELQTIIREGYGEQHPEV